MNICEDPGRYGLEVHTEKWKPLIRFFCKLTERRRKFFQTEVFIPEFWNVLSLDTEEGKKGYFFWHVVADGAWLDDTPPASPEEMKK